MSALQLSPASNSASSPKPESSFEMKPSAFAVSITSLPRWIRPERRGSIVALRAVLSQAAANPSAASIAPISSRLPPAVPTRTNGACGFPLIVSSASPLIWPSGGVSVISSGGRTVPPVPTIARAPAFRCADQAGWGTAIARSIEPPIGSSTSATRPGGARPSTSKANANASTRGGKGTTRLGSPRRATSWLTAGNSLLPSKPGRPQS